MRNSIITTTVLVLMIACVQQPKSQDTPEAILAQMHADTGWIHELDSLAQVAIGPGAKCLDPVKHTFSFEGRTWFFNQDWGGVLEIPTDYIPEDDLWQAELSFHGTRAWSPDSLILVSFYAGFQGVTDEESIEATIFGLEEDGFTVLKREEKEEVLTIRACSIEGVNYYGRQIFANEDGVEYMISVQYPDGKSSGVQAVIEMADRYPAGPNGNHFRGLVL